MQAGEAMPQGLIAFNEKKSRIGQTDNYPHFMIVPDMSHYGIYFKNLEIFKPFKFTLDHLLILTQPSRLSPCDLRSRNIFLLSGPL